MKYLFRTKLKTTIGIILYSLSNLKYVLDNVSVAVLHNRKETPFLSMLLHNVEDLCLQVIYCVTVILIRQMIIIDSTGIFYTMRMIRTNLKYLKKRHPQPVEILIVKKNEVCSKEYMIA